MDLTSVSLLVGTLVILSMGENYFDRNNIGTNWP